MTFMHGYAIIGHIQQVRKIGKESSGKAAQERQLIEVNFMEKIQEEDLVGRRYGTQGT